MGGSKPKPATPPINASSSDEADFIKCAHIPPAFPRAFSLTSYRKFMDQAEADEKKSKH
jgi:F-type H+-transporting ATPase subunit k